ncbi:class I SAM-dependent methyltransferase [Streptomyces sp. RFCAC02]|uniref:class I SAM-dependent methyltransferase n=1 Tax=Streptomyces sp. RFCAC02 TaxID=2499143 RepID=UPI0019D05500|nr:class I SAM-dependent methyltransferase [Streptomyces sp. RFCAC02]
MSTRPPAPDADPTDHAADIEQNRRNWDARVPVHAGSAFYDLAAFRAGEVSTLRPLEVEEVGDVTGLRLLHLQCHMGQDTLSWARLGADVTGLDFSAPAIDTARGLARDTGLADRARFVTSDVYGAPDALAGERFDLVYTGFGALVWLPDLPRWAATVAGLLKDGGRLYLAEFHPLTEVMTDDGRGFERGYFDTAPAAYDYPRTYTDGPELPEPRHVEWHHTLGEVVSAVAAAGLRVEFLHEHDVTAFGAFSTLEKDPASGLYRFPAGQPAVPLLYSLSARRTA